MRFGRLAPLGVLLVLCLPGAAWAVATNLDVKAGGEPVAHQTLNLRNTATGETKSVETDRGGAAAVDLSEGTWTASTPDGRWTSDPFRAGERVRLDLPRSYAQPGKEPHARGPWQFAIDLGGGYSWMDADSSADGNQVTEKIMREEVKLGPFPDSPVEIQEQRFLVDNFFAFDSSDASEGGFGSATFQVMGPPCGCWGTRPVLFGGLPFNEIDSTLIWDPGFGGREIDLSVDRYFFDLGLGIQKDLPYGFGVELGAQYRNDRIQLQAQFNPRDSTTFHVHSLGPRLNLTKRLLRRGSVELGLYAGVSVLFPVGDDSESLTLRGSNGSISVFEFEAKTQVSAGGGVRVLFDIPGL